jgi:hypothetical protein
MTVPRLGRSTPAPRVKEWQRSSRGVTAHVVEGFGRVAKRRPDSDRKREPTELDEPRHFRKRFGLRSKTGSTHNCALLWVKRHASSAFVG